MEAAVSVVSQMARQLSFELGHLRARNKADAKPVDLKTVWARFAKYPEPKQMTLSSQDPQRARQRECMRRLRAERRGQAWAGEQRQRKRYDTDEARRAAWRLQRRRYFDGKPTEWHDARRARQRVRRAAQREAERAAREANIVRPCPWKTLYRAVLEVAA